jgi:TPR repeat protein
MFASRLWQSPPMRQAKEPNSIPASVSIPPADLLTPQSTYPAPSEMPLQRGQSATEETSSRKPSQEASVRSSKAQIQPVSASVLGNGSETEGEKYLYGDGMPINCGRARQEFLAAAQHSSTKAQSALGTMYATGHCANRDLPLAYRWFARALRQNPRNRTIEKDMKLVWDQMGPEERVLAKR